MTKRLPKTKFIDTNAKKEIPKTSLENINVAFSFSDFKCRSLKCKIFNNYFESMWEYGAWSLQLIYRLCEYSQMNSAELKGGGRSTRCHIVEGESLERLKEILKQIKDTKPDENGTEDEQLVEDGYWELSLGKAEGRIYGYFIDNVFHVMLFDPHHLIYPNLKCGAQCDLLYRNYDPWNELKTC